MRIGYRPIGDDPQNLLKQAELAEEAGFDGLWIADDGLEPFVWSIAGALSQRTSLPVTALVDCSTTRIHPVVLARAAATCAMLSQHFTLGLNLANRSDDRLPDQQRRDMLVEAVDVIKRLWTGERVNHHGSYYTVEDTRLSTPPKRPPPVYLLAHDIATVRLADTIADGVIVGGDESDLMTEKPSAVHVVMDGGDGVDAQIRLLDRLYENGCENVYLSVPDSGDEAFFRGFEQHVQPRYV